MRFDGFILLLGLVCGASAFAQGAVTEPLLQEHTVLRAKLNHLDALNRGLPDSRPEDQKVVMRQMIGSLRSDVLDHADSEEKIVYPAIDKQARSAKPPLTESFRYEHRIMARWMDELGREAGQGSTAEFSRTANRLFGLVSAHLETEEEVLFPVLDRSMTKKQFEKEILSKLDQEERARVG